MEVGKSYEVTKTVKRRFTKFIGKVIEEYEDLYLLQAKNYKTSINKKDLICGDYTVRSI